eukprot:COSAG04_NODE_2854_length_3484_cov_1.515510_1_plen_58_part_10
MTIYELGACGFWAARQLASRASAPPRVHSLAEVARPTVGGPLPEVRHRAVYLPLLACR